jgi:hypothetical protein
MKRAAPELVLARGLQLDARGFTRRATETSSFRRCSSLSAMRAIALAPRPKPLSTGSGNFVWTFLTLAV